MTESSRRPQFQYRDAPDLMETFADSIGPWYFDGMTLRIEFLVSRIGPETKADSRTGTKLPVCRLVLTPTAAMELLNQAQRMAAALEKAGLATKAKQDSTRPQ